jgi:tRNA-specific 2-thiouridylase
MENKKAIALLSGGLDSTLALKIILDLGFEVIGLNLKTPFCTCDGKSGVCYSSKYADEFGINLIRIFGAEDYVEIIKNPKHGYGRNLNPCIDCRIYLFRKAKEVMEKEGAAFIFTGEVLGERPMSQRMDSMRLIEKESGLQGKILRPLSAKLLSPTLPEKEGLIDRSKLLNIQGRSRKSQIQLARDYQIGDYPCPAGGCLLTDESFARRLKDSFQHNEDSLRHISLLKIGRHFRLPTGAKFIVGRNKEENNLILSFAKPEETKFTVKGFKSTYGVLLGEPEPEIKILCAKICARYCQEKDLPKLIVKIWSESIENFSETEISPSTDSQIEDCRI